MSNYKSSIASKNAIYSNNTHSCSFRSSRNTKNAPKAVIPSKKITSTETKSTNGILNKKPLVRPKKTTKSENFTQKCPNFELDLCKKCGDAVEKQSAEKIQSIITDMNTKSVRNDNSVKTRTKKTNSIRQYYKNEKFDISADSAMILEPENEKKGSLHTIEEDTERGDLHAVSEDSILMVYPESEDDVTYLDPDDEDNIENLKQFRKNNYFECHSAKSRIKTRPSVINLNDHKCVYRFYLNDRLFPVPLNSDYNNKVRCVECHLPMNFKQDSKDEKINGTIQAKVKLGNETQDMVLLLPIKPTLIIEERRKEERKVNDEYMYFGVVKLNSDGNSTFNSTLPQDSLALKYQKGYKEYQIDEGFRYKSGEDDNVIII